MSWESSEGCPSHEHEVLGDVGEAYLDMAGTWKHEELHRCLPLQIGQCSCTTFIEELCTFAGAGVFASSTSISALAMLSRPVPIAPYEN